MAIIGQDGSATPGAIGYPNVAGANLLTYGGEGQTQAEALAGHAAEHAAMDMYGDGMPGPAVMTTFRNISHSSVTQLLMPSAPTELALLWRESGTSGALRFVVEAASLLDATARLADDTAHGELSSGDLPLLMLFEPTTSPTYLYFRATSDVGVGSNALTVIAKVPA